MLLGLFTLALLAAQVGQPLRAARLLGAAGALHEALGATLAPIDRRTHDQALDMIRAHLGEAEIAAALAAGRALTLDEAIAEAMSAGQPGPPPTTADPSGSLPEPLTRRER